MSEEFTDAELQASIVSLPPWAQRIANAALRRTVSIEDRIREKRESAAWPLLIQAAAVSNFLPSTLGIDADSPAELEVLELSETEFHNVGLRWALKPQVRRAVLNESLRSGELLPALRQLARLRDPVVRAVRDFVTKGSVELPRDVESLQTLREAVTILAGVDGLENLPKLDDLDRRIEHQRMLGQFRRMTGFDAEREARHEKRIDRFFGRDEELQRLRDHVGFLPPTSVRGRIGRAVGSLRRLVGSTEPMCIFGSGGVGKTTLVAKFMLEHANAAESTYPFVYLDFDRASVSARDPLALIVEMALQVERQFPTLSPGLARLRASARAAARTTDADAEARLRAATPSLGEFRKLIDGLLSEHERFYNMEKPFLVVFDTVELAQYGAADVALLQRFVQGLRTGTRQEVWSRLRIVLAGRNPVKQFLGPVKNIPLGELTPEKSAEMVEFLADEAGKHVGRKVSQPFVDAVVKAFGGKRGSGLPPLRLKLLGLLLAKTKESGEEFLTRITKELESPPSSGGPLDKTFVDGFLIRRILEAVDHRDVRALADPGLVVRRIRPEVVRRVMALGTTKPKDLLDAEKDSGSDDDSLAYKPWRMTVAESEAVYKLIEKEVSLVEPYEGGLRHIPTLRREMLPLIRRRRPNRFKKLQELARRYFAACLRRDPSDSFARSELIYHSLWAEVPLSDVEALWTDEIDPHIEPEEFPPDSVATAYLRERANERLSPEDLNRLPHDFRVGWLARNALELLDDPDKNGSVAVARAAVGDRFEALGHDLEIAAILARLLYRSGNWDSSWELIGAQLPEPNSVDSLYLSAPSQSESLVRTRITLAAKSGIRSTRFWEGCIPTIAAFRDEAGRLEAISYATLATDGAFDRSSYFDYGMRSGQSFGDRTLRLAALAAPSPYDRQYLHAFFQSFRRIPREIEIAPSVWRVFSALFGTSAFHGYRSHRDLAEHPEEYADVLDDIERRHDEDRSRLANLAGDAPPTLYTSLLELARFDHADWANPISHSLSRMTGTALVDGAKRGIQAALGKRWKGLQFTKNAPVDGPAVVQYAMDRFGLLPLARELAKVKDSTDRTELPESAPRIAAALLRWHDTLGRGREGAHRGLR